MADGVQNPPKTTDEKVKELEDALKKLEGRAGIWLEVADVQFESGDKACKVQLKADRAQPKPMWWPVNSTAVGKPGEGAAYDTYKAILHELDRKRLVLARLSPKPKSTELHCDAFRFQSPDLGSRST